MQSGDKEISPGSAHSLTGTKKQLRRVRLDALLNPGLAGNPVLTGVFCNYTIPDYSDDTLVIVGILSYT